MLLLLLFVLKDDAAVVPPPLLLLLLLVVLALAASPHPTGWGGGNPNSSALNTVTFGQDVRSAKHCSLGPQCVASPVGQGRRQEELASPHVVPQ